MPGWKGWPRSCGENMFRLSTVTFAGTETQSREFYMAVFGVPDASGIPPEITFSDDQPGLFVMDNDIPDGNMHLEAQIVSDTQIEGSLVFDAPPDCAIAYDFTLTPAG